MPELRPTQRTRLTQIAGPTGIDVSGEAVTSTQLRAVRGAELVNIRHWSVERPAGFSGRARQFVAPMPLALAEGERLILATRMHWCLPLRTAVKSIAAMPVALAVSVFLDFAAAGAWQLQLALWIGAGVHELHMGYLMVSWRTHLLVVTNRRVLSTEGLIVRRLKEINIGRRTNLEIDDQSVFGRILNYGGFRVEMAGVHDAGAKRELIRFVPDPFTVYNAMVTHAT